MSSGPILDVSRLSVIGQGKLGAPIAAALATRGFAVVGVDADPSRVEAINRLDPVVEEPGYPELLSQTGGRLSATTSIREATLNTDASLIIVPTPSGPDGGFAIDVVLKVVEEIGATLREKTSPHLVVVTSTVMPGDTQGPIRAALEAASGKTVGEEVLLCYSPEFVALGSVVRDYLTPGLILIGQADERSGDVLEAIALKATENQPPVARLNLVNAELAKLAVNTYVTTKITFANTLAQICSGLPGADVDQVTQAIGLDPRIGRRYLGGGLAYGGPCFPRDNRAMSLVAERSGADDALPGTVDQVNRAMTRRLAGLVRSQLDQGQSVAVLGLSYKPGSNVTEQAAGWLLAQALSESGVDVVAYDPVVQLESGVIRQADSLAQAVAMAQVVVLTTPWPQIVEALPAAFKAARQTQTSPVADARLRRVLIDGWRVIDPVLIESHAEVISLGRGDAVRRKSLESGTPVG